jgi:hypothetical protein
LFITDAQGEVASTWWEFGCGWQPWFTIHPESATSAPGQPVTAVWSNPQHLDLFVTGLDGRVISTWWEAAKSWRPWFAIHPEAGIGAPGQPVTAVWSNPQHLDLFITGRDGRVMSTWWEGAKGWQPWFAVHPESATGAPGQPVTAIWSNPQHLDLFVTGHDGRVMSTWWEAAKGWQPWFAIHPESATGAPGQPITAVWSNPQHQDLFVTGHDGQVMSTWWEGAKGWQPWFAIHPESATGAPGQSVTAVWSNPQHLDLFIMGRDGRVMSTWWEGAKGWQPWFAIYPESTTGAPGQPVTAVWSNPQHLDLFVTGHDGRVMSTWWDAAKSWQPWFAIFPDTLQARVNDPQNVVTQGHDERRTGAFPSERVLTPQTVASGRFGRLYSRAVEGQIFAQPLFIRHVATRNKGDRNLLVIATAANQVYAFDADDMTPDDSKALVFQKQLSFRGQLDPTSALEPAARNTDADLNKNCNQTFPYFFGITATPVIDPATDTLYVVAYKTSVAIPKTNPQQTGQYILYALDLRDDLNDRVDPVVVSAPGFSSHKGRNRAGLLLMNGMVYVAFGGFICDHPLDFSGWVFAYRKEDLSQAGAFRPDPSLMGAGVWQSGRGLVGDSGYVYFMTGNENARVPRPDTLANSFVKLGSSCHGDGLELSGSFTPSNTVQLSLGDTDLGSSGPLLLPGDRLIGAGKQGRVYVVDPRTTKLSQNQTSADGFEGFRGLRNSWHDDPRQPACAANADAICRKPLPGTYPFWEAGKEVPGVDCRTPQTDPLKAERCTVLNGWGQHLGSGSTPGCFLPVSCYQFDQGMGPNIHAGFVFWDGFPTISKGRLYALAEKDFLKSFEYDKSNGHVSEVPAAENQRIRTPDGMPGGALSVSSDWGSSGVLWVSTHDEDALSYVHPGHFYAVDASNLKILWEDSKIEFFAKFNAPIIADGKVFLATWGRSPNNNPDVQVKSAVVVYGLKP